MRMCRYVGSWDFEPIYTDAYSCNSLSLCILTLTLHILTQTNATRCASRGKSGPDNAGNYNSRFWEPEFFRDGGSWCTEYGHFFLGWYSSLLVRHADAVLTIIRKQLKETCSGVVLTSVEQVSSHQFSSSCRKPAWVGAHLGGAGELASLFQPSDAACTADELC
jgi:hypothetical protein